MRHTVAVLAATVLSTLIGITPTARADEPSPLYALVDASAQRLATADPVAAVKWVDGGAIEDPPRVEQVLNGVGADATARGIDEQFVRAAFTDQVHATEGIQYTRFGQWKLDPAAAPTTAPDLSSSRAAIDGFNRTMVSEMALQWPVLDGPDCVGDLAEATNAVSTDRRLDPLYQQALAFATRSYCDQPVT